jgi:hypothetical protein
MGLKASAIYWLRQFPFVYPRKIIDSCQEWIIKQGKAKGVYFSQRGPWCKEIFPAHFLRNPAPKTVGKANDQAFFINQNYPTPKATLFYLQNSYLLGHKSLILSADNELFQEFTHNFNISSLKKFLWKNPFYAFTSQVKKIQGTGAVLLSPESHNYYHWLNDVLPRIRLYEEVLDRIDHFCIASNVPEKFKLVLSSFGIPGEKIIKVGEREKLHFSNLFVASLPGSEGRSPRWAVDYLRRRLIPASGAVAPSKKIYFKRGMAVERRVLNEEELVTMLKIEGFEVADPGTMSIAGQVTLAQQAKVIISAHGAALANLLFVNAGATVIELFGPDYFRTDCYYTCAAILKLNYWYISGNKPPGAAWGDCIIDLQTVKDTLARTGV